MDFILATTNQGKVNEILNLLGKGHTVKTLADIDFKEEIIEDGSTFEENAMIKAKAVWSRMSPSAYDYIITDDSGLMIDSLDGKPGVHSARWLGVDTLYDVKNRQVLELLKDIPQEKRTARFVCVIACADASGRIITAKGTLEGRISFESAGDNGFGYDPIFFVPDKNRTLAQLSKAEKNLISHRASALKALCSMLPHIPLSEVDL